MACKVNEYSEREGERERDEEEERRGKSGSSLSKLTSSCL